MKSVNSTEKIKYYRSSNELKDLMHTISTLQIFILQFLNRFSENNIDSKPIKFKEVFNLFVPHKHLMIAGMQLLNHYMTRKIYGGIELLVDHNFTVFLQHVYMANLHLFRMKLKFI